MVSVVTASLISLILAVVALLLYYFYYRKLKNYPPGPVRLPILGNLLSIGDRAHSAFRDYAKRYGSIFSVKMASEEVVVLHGTELIKEAFSSSSFNFNGRSDNEAARLFLAGGSDGIFYAQGSVWTEHRRFAIRSLREFGLGKNSLEGLIMDEVKELIHWIRVQNENPMTLHRRFSLSVINTLWTILCGQRYDHDDPTVVGILEQLETTMNAVLGGRGKSLLIFFYPRIAKYFPNWSGWNFLLKSIEPRFKLLEETIREHQITLPEDHPRDFIDMYLQEIKKTVDPNSIFHKSTGTNALMSVMADFFIAGSDTTSVTMNWAILYLLRFPDIQTKLQKEIDDVVGRTRTPCLADRNSMPYYEAFIMEVMRINTTVAFATRATMEDVEFHGYHIPKGTSVYASLYSTHHDPKVWGDPENFRPERFLNKDGSKVEKHDSLMPFSTGRRQCPGEGFARDQLFLFITSIAQNFRILNEPGKPTPTLEIIGKSILLTPHNYFVVMKDRL